MIFLYIHMFCLLGSLAMLSYLIWFEAPRLTTDETRQRLFEQRDHLVQMIVDEELSWQDLPYRNTRRALNQFIRYAHELSLTRLVAGRIAHHKHLVIASDVDEESDLRGLDDVAKRKVLEIRRKSEYWMVTHVLKRSVFLSALIATWAAVCWIKELKLFGALSANERTEASDELGSAISSVEKRGGESSSVKLRSFGSGKSSTRPTPKPVYFVIDRNVTPVMKRAIEEEVGREQGLGELRAA